MMFYASDTIYLFQFWDNIFVEFFGDLQMKKLR